MADQKKRGLPEAAVATWVEGVVRHRVCHEPRLDRSACYLLFLTESGSDSNLALLTITSDNACNNATFL